MFGKKTSDSHDLELFVIYDSKPSTYRDPIVSPNQFEMVRAYENIIRTNPSDQLVTNAEDFAIFRVGTYIKKTGQIFLTDKEHIANLHELRDSYYRRNPSPPQPMANFNQGALTPT